MATAILKARILATFEFCVFSAPLPFPHQPANPCTHKHEHASRQQVCVFKQRRQMGSNPPGAPLLEDELDAEGDERKNSHPPHHASRGTAGGCEHVGVPHSQAAADMTQHQSWMLTKSTQTWSMEESGHEGDKEETEAGRPSERDSSGDDSNMSRRCRCCQKAPRPTAAVDHEQRGGEGSG